MFGASQLWGKVRRAFLLAIPERLYARSASFIELDRPLKLAGEVEVLGRQRATPQDLDDQTIQAGRRDLHGQRLIKGETRQGRTRSG